MDRQAGIILRPVKKRLKYSVFLPIYWLYIQ
ncbi:MAG: hypothetical protein ACI8V0_002751 [Pseudohongiellaceae bacterium]